MSDSNGDIRDSEQRKLLPSPPQSRPTSAGYRGRSPDRRERPSSAHIEPTVDTPAVAVSNKRSSEEDLPSAAGLPVSNELVQDGSLTNMALLTPNKRQEESIGEPASSMIVTDSSKMNKYQTSSMNNKDEDTLSVLSFDNIVFDPQVSTDVARDNFNKIRALQQSIAQENIDTAGDAFAEQVEEDVLVIGSIPIDQVEAQEKKLEEARITALVAEADRQRMQLEELDKREREAKANVLQSSAREKKELRFHENRLVKRHFHQMRDQQEAFRKAEDTMRKLLVQQQADITEYFGDLNEADDLYGAVKGRRYKVDWSHAPRIVRLRIDLLRAVKNKLPRGRYVVMVTLYDRLGGHPLRWSKLQDIKWTGSTPFPRRHNGKFYNLEMSFAQKRNRIFIACPSKVQARPSMVFVFELFLCRGRNSKTDTVVGWGAFPMYDSTFEPIQGSFRVPLLRGPMDPNMDKFERLEDLYCNNLDAWLCNLYFDARHLPRYVDQQKEYEVEFKFTSQLLSLQDRKDEQGTQSDPDESGNEEEEDEAKAAKDTDGENSDDDQALNEGNASDDEEEKVIEEIIDEKTFNEHSKKHEETESKKTKDSSKIAEKDKPDETSNKINGDLPPTTTVAETTGKNVSFGGDSKGGYEKLNNEDDGDPAEQITVKATRTKMTFTREATEVKERMRPYDVPAKDAVIRIKSKTHTGMFREQKDWPIAPEPFNTAKKNDPVKRAKELERYKFSVIDVDRDVPANQGAEKIRYLLSELYADLGLSRYKTFEFWATILLAVLLFWLRILTHTTGQYLFLEAIRIPVFTFSIGPVWCNLLYPNANLDTFVEIGVTVMGVGSNIILFSIGLSLGWLSQRLLGTFPDTASRFMLCFGVLTILDPILILIVDLARQNWQGDAFKLYNLFHIQEGNGLAGVLLTAVLTSVLIVLAGFIFYNYLLHIHMNGRMMDVHYRLHGDESSFFTPDDMEISVRTLRWILMKAKRWTGFHGATRKISVTSYVMKDHLDSTFEERTIHLALYTQDIYGERELYRHFVRRSDGAIIEIFDALELMGADDYRNLEKMLLSGDPESDPNAFLEPKSTNHATTSSLKKGKKPAIDLKLAKAFTFKDPVHAKEHVFNANEVERNSSAFVTPRKSLTIGSPRPDFIGLRKPSMELPQYNDYDYDEEKTS